jgi:hypothetical protein
MQRKVLFIYLIDNKVYELCPEIELFLEILELLFCKSSKKFLRIKNVKNCHPYLPSPLACLW